MQNDLATKISVKLFIGFHLNSEIRMLLGESRTWKQVSISPIENREAKLMEAHFNGKDYLGCYSSSEKITLAQVREIESLIRKTFQFYCPALDMEDIKVCLFPQVFIA